jgi:hypothetical protein
MSCLKMLDKLEKWPIRLLLVNKPVCGDNEILSARPGLLAQRSTASQPYWLQLSRLKFGHEPRTGKLVKIDDNLLKNMPVLTPNLLLTRFIALAREGDVDCDLGGDGNVPVNRLVREGTYLEGEDSQPLPVGLLSELYQRPEERFDCNMRSGLPVGDSGGRVKLRNVHIHDGEWCRTVIGYLDIRLGRNDYISKVGGKIGHAFLSQDPKTVYSHSLDVG